MASLPTPVTPTAPTVPTVPTFPSAPVAPIIPGSPSGPLASMVPSVPLTPAVPLGSTVPSLLSSSAPVVSGLTSTLDVFKKEFSRWMESSFLPTLSHYLKEEKKCEVSTEELMKVLGLPTTPNNTNSFQTMMGVPDAIIGPKNAIPTSSNASGDSINSNSPGTKAATGGRGRRKVQTNVVCGYKFVKGPKENQTCGKPELKWGYCRACMKKGDAKTELSKRNITDDMINKVLSDGADAVFDGGSTSGGESSSIINTIAPTKPAASVPTAPVAPVMGTTINTVNNITRNINMKPVPGQPNLFIMENEIPGAMFYLDVKNQAFICIGKYIHNMRNNPYELSPDEERLVASMGLAYMKPEAGAGESKAPPASNGHNMHSGAPNSHSGAPHSHQVPMNSGSSGMVAPPVFGGRPGMMAPGTPQVNFTDLSM